MSDPNVPSPSAESSSEIARRIRSARARAGLTRKQLADAAQVSERYLATLEAGAGNPSLEKLIAIADALNVALAELLPAGGERGPALERAAAALRRLSPARLDEALAWLHQPVATSSAKARRIALIGLRGAGKSSLGKALAERMNLPFFEISQQVEAAYGGSIAVMLEIGGPAALRRYEAQVLDDILAQHPAAVIAAPGAIVSAGALYDQVLQTCSTVWLEASPEDHMARVTMQGDLRPMAGNRAAMADLKAILGARASEYARADARLDTSRQDFAATLDLLTAIVRGFT